MTNLYFPICALFISSLLLIMFFTKKRAKIVETKIYLGLLITNFLDSLLGTILIYIGYTRPESVLINILNRLDFPQYLLWVWFFFLYVSYISVKNPKEKKFHANISKTTMIINVIAIILLFILPYEVMNENNIMYAYGPGVSFLYIFCGIYLISALVIVAINFKNLKSKKYTPVYALILLAFLIIIVRASNPELLLISAVISYIDLIMYFTIENPDLKMIAELNIAKEQAEKANHAKSDFLSSMSHEIRTPLNAIVGLSEDMLNRENIPEDMKEDLEDITMASRTLLEIVGNIMDINKIESEKMEIIETPYNFREEAQALAKVNATRIGDKNIEFNVNIAEDIPYELLGDKIHIKQIINNLLSNAIKYTDEGEINFNAKCINEEDKTLLIIMVKDTGRGIKSDNINKLFTKFERLDIEKNTTTEGTGLGLAITKRLVELMGGKINVESNFGKGTLFIVQIPQKISQLNEPLTSDKSENQENSEENIQENSNYKKILIVDDNELNIKVAKRVLKDFEFDINECYNGQECLDKIISGEKYDLILMDIMMPIMNGEKAIQELKNLENFNTPVLALTADAVSGAKERYMKLGFVDCLTKPFSKEQIKTKIDDIFKEIEYNSDIEEIDIL